MTDLHLSTHAFFSLLQWCDGLFPSGAFSHSFGLESAVQSGKVKNGSDLSEWIRAKLRHQVFPCDLVFLRQAKEAGEKHDLDRIQKVDETAWAMRLPRELREGGRMIASRLIQTAAALYPHTWTHSCGALLAAGKLKGDPAVAFGIVAVGAKIPLHAASLAYVYMLTAGQVSASLRLMAIGQQEAQRLIRSLLAWVEQHLNDAEQEDPFADTPASFMPASEIASMQHERAPVRLFQS